MEVSLAELLLRLGCELIWKIDRLRDSSNRARLYYCIGSIDFPKLLKLVLLIGAFFDSLLYNDN